MKKTVVSFADGSGSYAKSLMRLELSLKQVGFDGTNLVLISSYQTMISMLDVVIDSLLVSHFDLQ